MRIYRRRLKTTLSLINRDLKEGGLDEWWYTTGTVVRFSSDVDQSSYRKKMVKEAHLDTYHNMLYGGILADAFLTRFRSTYDTIAKAFKEIMRDPGHAPKLSFSVFREFCNKKEEEELMPGL